MNAPPEKRKPGAATPGLVKSDLAITDHTTEADCGAQRICEAAAWLAEHWHVAPQPVTRTLRLMFGLGFNDAVKAIAEARRIGRRE